MYQELIKPFFTDAKNFVLDTLFPIHCLRCDKEGKFICDGCLPQLTRLKDQYCITCGRPSPMGFTHPGCKTPHCADGLVSILNYHDESVSNILIKGKYNFLPDVYKILGKMVAAELQSNFLISQFPNFHLVPIPLSSRRQRWRGFNQAEVLCEAIGKELSLPVMDALVRCKSTKIQKDVKKREDRIRNVSGAFSLAHTIFPSPIHGEGAPSASDPFGNTQGRLERSRDGEGRERLNISTIRDRNFILLDDVTTTGSTLLEAAKVLKRNGASSVWCLTVARD